MAVSAWLPRPIECGKRPAIKDARDGEQSAVVWKLLKRRPPSARRSMFGVLIRPPKLPTWANPTSSNRNMMTFGASSFGLGSSGHHSTESS